MSKLKKSRPPWWLCSHKRRLFTVSHKIGFLPATHPPWSHLSLTTEHHVAVSLRKSIEVSEPAVDMGKRKSLNASLKQWHFFSEWTKNSSSFIFCRGIAAATVQECTNSLKVDLFFCSKLSYEFWQQLPFVQEGTILWKLFRISVAIYCMDSEHCARKSAAAVVQRMS